MEGLCQLADPQIRRLLDVLVVEVDPECVAVWPEACMNRVTVRFTDGSQESESVRGVGGRAGRPSGEYRPE